MNKKYIFSLLSLAVTPAFAQMDNTVEVETSVTPIVKDANKINVLPQVVESESDHISVNYSTKVIKTKKYSFTPVDLMGSETPGDGAGKGFLSLGGGVCGNLDIHGAYGFNLSKNDVLGLRFSVDGFSSGNKIPKDIFANSSTASTMDYKTKSRFYTTRGGVDYTHKYAKGLSEFFIKFGLESQVFNYQLPTNSNFVTDKQHNSLGGISIGSTDYQSNSFRICGDFGFDFFNQKYLTNQDKKCSESQVHFNLDLGVILNEENSINVDFGMNNSSYGMSQYDSYTHAHILSYYRFEDYDFSVKAGLFIGAGGLAPDVRFTYHPSESFDVYANVVGYETENDFRAFNALNPYALMEKVDDAAPKVKVKPEFHQIDIKGGIRFRSESGFAGDINLGYDKSKNRAELTSLYYNSPNAIIATVDGSRFYVNADFVYNCKDAFKIDLRNQFNAWSVDKDFKNGIAISRPAVDLDWNFDARISHGFFAGADIKIQSFSNAGKVTVMTSSKPSSESVIKTYNRPTMFDFGLTGHYVFDNIPLSIYANVDNLFNCKYDRFYGYRNVGINFIVGAAYTF